MSDLLVVMGVAGAGKSTLAQAVASATGFQLIEGDDFHSAASRRKMADGEPLTDDDRRDWLDRLIGELLRQRRGAVLTCSALKRSYRDRFREAVPSLRFVYLHIDEHLAHERVSARAPAHMFPPSLVPSQFAALEPPQGEPGVLHLDAAQPLQALVADVRRWLEVCPQGDAE